MRLRLCVMALACALSPLASAQHLGTDGQVFPIIEPDMIEMMKARMQAKMDSGELDRLRDEARERVKANAQEPPTSVWTPVTAVNNRTFWFDPTIRVDRAIMTSDGKVVVPAGTVVNPLQHAPFAYKWIFIDGRDERQIAWAKTQLKDPSVRPIFVAGRWIDYWRTWQRRTYFDMGNTLTRKLGIEAVPAIVTQDKDKRRIRIEEVAMR